MAEPEDPDIMSTEEQQLVRAFRYLNVKPDVSDPEHLVEWMKSFTDTMRGGAKAKTVKTEPQEGAVSFSGQHDQHPQVQPSGMGHDPSPDPHLSDSSTGKTPRLSIFYGDKSNKGEATYQQWRYEVKCLVNEHRYSDSVILESIRRSLKGEAKDIVMRLGYSPSIAQILEKFESVYGSVEVESTILAQFYSARQRDDEDVSSWSLRLEHILSEAVELGQVQSSDTNDMLRSTFFMGLRPHLRDVCGHKYDAIREFDKLRVEVRRLEQQQRSSLPSQNPSKQTHCKSATDVASDKFAKIEGLLSKLQSDVDQLKSVGVDSHIHQQQFVSLRQNNNNKSYPHQQPNHAFSYRPPNPRHNQHPPVQHPRPASGRQYRPNVAEGRPERAEPTCWRCGQRGHMQIGCRVRLDHNRGSHLNFSAPAKRGQP